MYIPEMAKPTYRRTLREWTHAQTPEEDDKIVVFLRPGCPYCEKTIALLDQMGSTDDVVKVDVSQDKTFATYKRSMEKTTGCKTVPKVFHDGVFVGDSQAAAEHFENL